MKSSPTRINPDAISIQSFASGAIDAAGVVVIIDVFRAFTVAPIALANGARRIIMVGDLDQALALRQQNLGHYCIGERGGIMPPEFDFGNSPAEIFQLRFDGKTLIQTTSNGTRGILAATGARKIYAGSLVTAEATVRAIASYSESQVRLVPMGDKDIYRADEDEICALYMRSRLEGRNPDLVAVRQAIETMSSRSDSGTLSQQDIDCCLQINSIPLAIKVKLKDGLFVATAE